jgi:hypothetical protein
MKPSWIRRNNDPFEIRGRWKTLAGRGDADWATKKVQVLILQQLCRMTFWLAIIGVSQVILTCDIVTYR